jgi:hypothetical protein
MELHKGTLEVKVKTENYCKSINLKRNAVEKKPQINQVQSAIHSERPKSIVDSMLNSNNLQKYKIYNIGYLIIHYLSQILIIKMESLKILHSKEKEILSQTFNRNYH